MKKKYTALAILIPIAAGFAASTIAWAVVQTTNDVKLFEADRRLEEKFDSRCEEIRRVMADYVANTREDVQDIKKSIRSNSKKFDELNRFLREHRD